MIEFDKKLLGKIHDDEILSRMELGGVLGEFKEIKDPKKSLHSRREVIKLQWLRREYSENLYPKGENKDNKKADN